MISGKRQADHAIFLGCTGARGCPNFQGGLGFAPRFARKDWKLRLAYAGWDDTKVVQRTATGKLAEGGVADPPPPAGTLPLLNPSGHSEAFTRLAYRP